jgi:hypothetical protein
VHRVLRRWYSGFGCLGLQGFDVCQHVGLHGFFNLFMGLPLDHVGKLRAIGGIIGFVATANQYFIVVWVGALWLLHGNGIVMVMDLTVTVDHVLQMDAFRVEPHRGLPCLNGLVG